VSDVYGVAEPVTLNESAPSRPLTVTAAMLVVVKAAWPPSWTPLPELTVKTLAGSSVPLRSVFKPGRKTIVNVWATWCTPCRQEMRALQTVYEAHKTAGLAVLAVSQDHQGMREAVRAYCTTLGLTFTPLLDPEGQVAAHYNVFVLPSTVFIYPSGTVAAVHLGAMTSAQIEQYLRAILPRPE
jgi:peroxiredoxin